MNRPGMDRFLTCVVRRSESDTIIRVGALLLIMVVVPVMAILLTMDLLWVYNNYLSDPEEVIELADFLLNHLDDFVGAHLMEYTIGTFVLYLIFNSYLRHCKRDLVWMDSLIEYVDSYGRDTTRMRSIRNKADEKRTSRVTRGFLIWFIIVLSLCMLQALFISLRNMQTELAMTTINILILVMIVQMAFTSIYIYRHIVGHSRLQHVFTEEFRNQMSEDLPKLETTEALESHISIWKYLPLLVMTFGLFSIVSTLWSIHMMNHHIRDQWYYEEKTLRMIAIKEEVTAVDRVFSEKEKTRTEKFIMFMTR